MGLETLVHYHCIVFSITFLGWSRIPCSYLRLICRAYTIGHASCPSCHSKESGFWYGWTWLGWARFPCNSAILWEFKRLRRLLHRRRCFEIVLCAESVFKWLQSNCVIASWLAWNSHARGEAKPIEACRRYFSPALRKCMKFARTFTSLCYLLQLWLVVGIGS